MPCVIGAIPSIHPLQKTIPLGYIIKFDVAFLSRLFIGCYHSMHDFIKTRIGRTIDPWLNLNVYKGVAHLNPFQAAGIKSLADFSRLHLKFLYLVYKIRSICWNIKGKNLTVLMIDAIFFCGTNKFAEGTSVYFSCISFFTNTLKMHCLIDEIPSIHSVQKTIPLAYIIKFHLAFLSRLFIGCYKSTHDFIKTHIGRTIDSWLNHNVCKVVARF